jgi:DNA-binding PadR family transcriptional regulator
MPTGAASFRHVILGLLVRQPMSGYDIKRYLKSLNWLIGNPSSGSLYPVLRALLQDGCATVEVHLHESRPPRKVYSVTEAGRRELKEWIDRPVKQGAPLRAFLMRLVVADTHPPALLVPHLRQRRAQVALKQAALEQMILARGEVNSEWNLAPDYGLALASAEISWLDKALDQLTLLAQQRSPMEVAEGDSAKLSI